MKQSLTLVVLVLALVGVGAAPALSAKTPLAKGSLEQDNQLISFRAKGTPQQASGRLKLGGEIFLAPTQDGPLTELRGTVDCLAVKGRRAAFSGRFDQPFAGGDFFSVLVVDKGSGGDAPDRLRIESQTSKVSNCAKNLKRVSSKTRPIDSGTITVRRARGR